MVSSNRRKPTPFQAPRAVQQQQQARSPLARDEARLAGVQAAIGGLPPKQSTRPTNTVATRAPVVPTNNAGATRSIGTVQTPLRPQQPATPAAKPAPPPAAVTSPALLRQAIAQRGGGSGSSAPGINNPYTEQKSYTGVSTQTQNTGMQAMARGANVTGVGTMFNQATGVAAGATPTTAVGVPRYQPGTPYAPTLPTPERVDESPGSPWGSGGVLNPGTGAKPEAPPSMAELRDQAIRDLLEGNVRDTSDEEALIRELMEAEIGANLVDARASMGRAGYASGGALYALEGDVRNKARQQALQEMFDVQRGARGEHREDISMGLEANADAEDRAFENWLRGELIESLASDGEKGFDEPTVNDPTKDESFNRDDWLSGDSDVMNERRQQGIPEVGDRHIGSDGTYDYWIGATGERFVVKHHGSPYGG